MPNSFASPWSVARQTPLSVGFPRQEYWSGLLCPPPGDLPKPGIEPKPPALAGLFFATEPSGKPLNSIKILSYTVICRISHQCWSYVSVLLNSFSFASSFANLHAVLSAPLFFHVRVFCENSMGSMQNFCMDHVMSLIHLFTSFLYIFHFVKSFCLSV